MDWLRSEDLKEEKEVTAPPMIIALLGSRAGIRVLSPPDSRRYGKWKYVRNHQNEGRNERSAQILLTANGRESCHPTSWL